MRLQRLATSSKTKIIPTQDIVMVNIKLILFVHQPSQIQVLALL